MGQNKKDNLKKKDISKDISSKSGLSILYASKFLDETIKIFINGLKKDGMLKISKFGSFSVIFKRKRIGRNPKNNKIYEISKRKTVSFKASSYLKEKLNQNE